MAGISFSTTEKSLAEAFSGFGEVVEGMGVAQSHGVHSSIYM